LRKNIIFILSLLIIIFLIGTCVFDTKQEDVPIEKMLMPKEKVEYYSDSCIVILNKNWEKGKLDSVLSFINNRIPVFYPDADLLVFITKSHDTIKYDKSLINSRNPLFIFTGQDAPIFTNADRFSNFFYFYFPKVNNIIKKQDSIITTVETKEAKSIIKEKELKSLNNKQRNQLFYKKTKRTLTAKPPQKLNDRNLYYPIITDNHIFSIRFDNDFWDYTDYYYTNGAAIGYTHPIFASSPISRILVSNGKSGIDYHGLQVVQHMYTGLQPKVDSIVEGDRPWSAYSTIGQYLISFDTKNKLKHYSEFNVGLLGPQSGGGFLQNFVHVILPNNSPPKGWHNQIATDIILDYQYNIRKHIFEAKRFESYISASAQIGTLRDNISWGFGARYGKFIPFYQDKSIYKRKRIDAPFARKLRYNLVFSIDTKLIGYDATLQGGVFNKNSIYTLSSGEINRFVVEAYGGFELSYGLIELQFLQYWKSREFYSGQDHKYVSVRLNFAF
jgi:hypothetical protein